MRAMLGQQIFAEGMALLLFPGEVDMVINITSI